MNVDKAKRNIRKVYNIKIFRQNPLMVAWLVLAR